MSEQRQQCPLRNVVQLARAATNKALWLCLVTKHVLIEEYYSPLDVLLNCFHKHTVCLTEWTFFFHSIFFCYFLLWFSCRSPHHVSVLLMCCVRCLPWPRSYPQHISLLWHKGSHDRKNGGIVCRGRSKHRVTSEANRFPRWEEAGGNMSS